MSFPHQFAPFQLYSKDECQGLMPFGKESTKKTMTQDNMCSMAEGKGACSGDSGGPVVVENGKQENNFVWNTGTGV